tara:strand:- start:224 stop:2245 length:2022 start_codon:yes stop_codon:yes gene_type:complete
VRSVAVGDFDNDGDLDIVSGSYDADYEVFVWQNDGSPFSDTWIQNDVGATTNNADVNSVRVGDLDNDGDLDIVSSTGNAGGEVIVWPNTQLHRNAPFDSNGNGVGESIDAVYEVAIGDLDNDGNLDIVSGGDTDENYEVIIWENDGSPFSGTWTPNDVGTSTDSLYSITLGDLDNDGYLDIISGSTGGEVVVWQNDGTPFSGYWTTYQEVGESDASVNSVRVGDLDNDGYLDIVSGSSGGEDNEVIVWENDGSPFDSTWTQNDVGASTSSVYGVAVGDLDNDGDLDIVSGSTGAEDYEVIVWENDGSPFDSTWTPNDVGASVTSVRSVVVGDLDNDGYLDIVSGGGNAEDYEVIAWRNDGSPFDSTWTQNDVGASTHNVWSVVVGDLNNDGYLDIVSGSSGAEYEVIAWQNDGSPFSGTWTQNDVGASIANVWPVAVGDLDNDGDPDIIAGCWESTDSEIIIWQNAGGSAGYTVTDSDDGVMDDSETNDVLIIKVEHNGISTDNDLEIEKWSFLFEETDGDVLTTSEAKSIFANLFIYVDDGDDNYDSGDTLAFTIASASISLTSGVQEFDFSEGSNFQISQSTGSKTYLLVIEMESDASSQGLNTFRITFDPDADTLNEDKTEDTSISVADSTETNTGNIDIAAIPEFSNIMMPIVSVLAIVGYNYRRRLLL